MRNRRHALTQAVRMLTGTPGACTQDVLRLADFFVAWLDRAPDAPCTDELCTEWLDHGPSTDETSTQCEGDGRIGGRP